MKYTATRECAVDYDTTAYRRSDGGATWLVMFEEVIGLLSSVTPLARWRECVPLQVSPLLIRTLSKVDSWKTVHHYIPQQKLPRKDKSAGCPL